MVIDPICGMTVDEHKAKFVSEYDGMNFYFCSAPCKSTFEKDTHNYAHK